MDARANGMNVDVLHPCDRVDFESELPNDRLSIIFDDVTGCEFITGLEWNMMVRHEKARALLVEGGYRKAVRRLDRNVKKYQKHRFVWN